MAEDKDILFIKTGINLFFLWKESNVIHLLRL